MPVSERVRDDDDAADHAQGYLICAVGKRFGIYEDASYYSQTSGGVQKRGTRVRRYDPDAGDQEGRFAAFDTPSDAVAYCNRWLASPKGVKS